MQSAPDSPVGAHELTMRDVNPKSGEETAYECFQCGNIIIKEHSPGRCPDCSGPMRNRQTPLE